MYKTKEKNDKTTVIHIGNKTNCNYKCPDLYVNEVKIKESNQSKYLGNIIASKNSIKKLIDIRKKKGAMKMNPF